MVRLRVDMTTVLLVGAGAYLLWRLRGVRLGPPSDDLMQYLNQPVRPPIWENLLDDLRNWSFGDGWAPYTAEEARRAAEAAENINDATGWSRGGLGSL